jgi:hypothetical protein
MVHHLLLGNPIANKINFTRLSSAVAAASHLPLRQGVDNINVNRSIPVRH